MDIDEILERHNKAFNLQNVILKANAKQAIKEIVKETLRMAAEAAELECRIYEKFAGKYSAENFGQEVCINTDERQYIGIDKDSITNVINKIKFYMEKKEQIEKEANEYAYAFGNGIFNDGLYKGFVDSFNSKISERIKLEFALEVLEELKQESPFPNYVPHQYINNKITELKNSIK